MNLICGVSEVEIFKRQWPHESGAIDWRVFLSQLLIQGLGLKAPTHRGQVDDEWYSLGIRKAIAKKQM